MVFLGFDLFLIQYLKLTRKPFSAFNLKSFKKEKIPIFLLIFLLLLLSKIFFSTLTVNKEAIWTGNAFVWIDWPVHFSLISSFAFGQNFPPINPQFNGLPLNYPFLSDFFSAILIKLGASLEWAVEIPGIILSVSFFMIFYFFVKFLSKSARIALISTIISLFAGGLGFIYFIQDIFKRTQPLNVYTYFGEKHLWFFNFLYGELIPQRAFLFGLPLFFLILRFFFQARKSGNIKMIFFTGFLTGLLPFFHTHTLFALVIYLGSLMIFDLFKNSFKNLSFWLKFWLPVLTLLLCQLPFFLPVFKNHNFHWQFGWMAHEENFFLFWFKNTGLFVPLLILAFLKVKSFKEKFLIFLPAQLIFIIPNLFLLAPWEYDNLKVLTYWFLLSSPLVASLLVFLKKKRFFFVKIIASFLFLTLIITGLIDVFNLFSLDKKSFLLWQNKDLKIAEFCQKNTAPQAIFLTAPVHNNPVNCLAGRKILLGYPGTAWTWGLEIGEREKEIKKIYKGDKETPLLLNKYDVDYIFVGPIEKNPPYSANLDFFEKNFKKIYEKDEFLIYQVES